MAIASSSSPALHSSAFLPPFPHSTKLSLQETASMPEFAGLWCDQEKSANEGGRRLKLSKLEVKMMEEARKKQKENIVQPQVVVMIMMMIMMIMMIMMVVIMITTMQL